MAEFRIPVEQHDETICQEIGAAASQTDWSIEHRQEGGEIVLTLPDGVLPQAPLNGVLSAGSRATSGDTLDGQIRTNSFSRLLAASAGVQAVTFEWAKQSGAGTLLCNPPAAADVFAANLKIEEYAAA